MPWIPSRPPQRMTQDEWIKAASLCWRCVRGRVLYTDELGLCDGCKDELRDPAFVKQLRPHELVREENRDLPVEDAAL